MRIIDSIIAAKINTAVNAVLDEERAKAREDGFELGKLAQQEEYMLHRTIVGTEQTHSLNCPQCKSKIHIPCINVVLQEQDNGKRD